MDCSLKETVELYEKTMTKKEATEEVEVVEEPLIDEVFERMLASKLRPDILESEEYGMLSRFVSQLSKKEL